MKKFLLFTMLLVAAFVATTACSEEEPLPIEVASVEIAPNDDFSLKIGETKALTASVKPADAENKTIAWSSSNAAVASVDNKGVVTALTAGSASITAKSINGKTDAIGVTVKADEPEPDPKPEPVVGITFVDANFKAALLSATGEYKIDTNDDGKITEEEAAKVKKINVSGKGITSMEEIKYFTALEELDASNNKIGETETKSSTAATIPLELLKNLKTLLVNGNNLTSLNVSTNSQLTTINVSDNKITTLDVSTNISLTTLNVSDNKITTLDVSTNTSLTTLEANDNKITTLDVSANVLLTTIDISNNKITKIDITANVNLTEVTVGGQTDESGTATTITVTMTVTQSENEIITDDKDDGIKTEEKEDPEKEDAELNLSTKDKEITAVAGSFTINVTSNAAWTVSDIPSWITLSPKSGNGNATVTITYTANEAKEERKAEIKFSAGTGDNIDSETLTIEQKGKAEEPDPDPNPDPKDPETGNGNLDDLDKEQL